MAALLFQLAIYWRRWRGPTVRSRWTGQKKTIINKQNNKSKNGARRDVTQRESWLAASFFDRKLIPHVPPDEFFFQRIQFKVKVNVIETKWPVCAHLMAAVYDVREWAIVSASSGSFF